MRVVLYTGGTPLGNEMAKELQAVSDEVIIYGEKSEIPEEVTLDPIDLLILVGGSQKNLGYLDGEIGMGHDYDGISAYLTEQMMIRYDLIQKYMPALKKGVGKRIGFVSYRYASVSDNKDTENFALHMDAAGMSMQAKMVHEKYHNCEKETDLTVRYFAAETCVEERKKGISATQYILMDFCQDKRYDPRHYEENHLRMRDHKFVQIPW